MDCGFEDREIEDLRLMLKENFRKKLKKLRKKRPKFAYDVLCGIIKKERS